MVSPALIWVKARATAVAAIGAAVLTLSATASEMAGWWDFPVIVTESYLEEVLDEKVNLIVNVILTERDRVASSRMKLTFQLRQARLVLENLEEGSEARTNQETVIEQIQEELESLGQ